MQDTNGWKSLGEWIVIEETTPPDNTALLAPASMEKEQVSEHGVVLFDSESGEFTAGEEIEFNPIVKIHVRINDRLFPAIPIYNIIARRRTP